MRGAGFASLVELANQWGSSQVGVASQWGAASRVAVASQGVVANREGLANLEDLASLVESAIQSMHQTWSQINLTCLLAHGHFYS